MKRLDIELKILSNDQHVTAKPAETTFVFSNFM